MKYHSLIIGLSVLALQSCTDNFYTEPGMKATFTGNTCQTAFTGNSSISTFSPGSQTLLNASGSLQIDNQVLTYIDNQWKARDEFDWTDGTATTKVTAFYPVYPDLAYTKEKLYSKGGLEDVLYAKDEFPAEASIHLQFKHLFSLLTLHLDKDLQTDFQKIEVTCPAVSSVIPKSAEIILADNETHTTTITQISPAGNYSFIIPPAENITATIDIQTNGGIYTTQLTAKSFTDNQEYTYHLKTSEKTPGIATAEDWIAFSRLINHNNITEYNGKTLADFGKTVNGITTYYLLNDIDFEGVDCSELEYVGGWANKDRIFKDVFDGRGHKISNLILKPFNGYAGLFGKTGSSSIIKNLHMELCSSNIKANDNSANLGIGTIAGFNLGTIINCSVKNCLIISEQEADTGGLAGCSKQAIINCKVENTNISSKYYTGGLAGNACGVILNSFAANDTVKSTSNYSGGLIGRSFPSMTVIMANCYVHAITLPSIQRGALIGNSNQYHINNLFYPISSPNPIGNIKTTVTGASPYHFTNETKDAIYQLLNQWIDETAPTLYPNYTFTRWTDGGESLPAIFITDSQSESK